MLSTAKHTKATLFLNKYTASILKYVIYWPPQDLILVQKPYGLGLREIKIARNVVAVYFRESHLSSYLTLVLLRDGKIDIIEETALLPAYEVAKGAIRGKYRISVPEISPIIPLDIEGLMIYPEKEGVSVKWYNLIVKTDGRVKKDLFETYTKSFSASIMLSSLADILKDKPVNEPSTVGVLKAILNANSVEELMKTRPEIVAYVWKLYFADYYISHVSFVNGVLSVFGHPIGKLRNILHDRVLKDIIWKILSEETVFNKLVNRAMLETNIPPDKVNKSFVLIDLLEKIKKREEPTTHYDEIYTILKTIVMENYLAEIGLGILLKHIDPKNNTFTIYVFPYAVRKYLSENLGCRISKDEATCPIANARRVSWAVKHPNRVFEIVSRKDPDLLKEIVEDLVSFITEDGDERLKEVLANAVTAIHGARKRETNARVQIPFKYLHRIARLNMKNIEGLNNVPQEILTILRDLKNLAEKATGVLDFEHSERHD